jgi:hypothetical protein
MISPWDNLPQQGEFNFVVLKLPEIAGNVLSHWCVPTPLLGISFKAFFFLSQKAAKHFSHSET